MKNLSTLSLFLIISSCYGSEPDVKHDTNRMADKIFKNVRDTTSQKDERNIDRSPEQIKESIKAQLKLTLATHRMTHDDDEITVPISELKNRLKRLYFEKCQEELPHTPDPSDEECSQVANALEAEYTRQRVSRICILL